MKPKIYITLILSLFSLLANSQWAFPFQGIAYDASGEPIANQTIGIINTIESIDGVVVAYTERHQVLTNDTGSFSMSVGYGQSGVKKMEWIDWSLRKWYLKTEIDQLNSGQFTLLGKTEIMAVPFALSAYHAGNRRGAQGAVGPSGAPGPPGPVGARGPCDIPFCCGVPSTGRNGVQGDPGPAGSVGLPGPDGISYFKDGEIGFQQNGSIYIDNGENRADGKPGFRYYDVDKWVDL